ncbi:MAG: sulfatase-like hydrolase/transferase [Halobacteriaceae archaeon]
MSDRPNVLVVLTDQQRWDTVGAYGNPMDLTPNLDAAAERGTRVEQAITPQPVCGPARACLQTGRHGTEHGVFTNGRVPDFETEALLAEQFADAGYDTGYVGKWHLANARLDPVSADKRAGYDFWRAAGALEWTSHPYEGTLYDEDDDPVEFDGYRVDAVTDHAEEFIRQDRDDPFFCILSILEPHHQNDMDTYVAPDGYAHRYRDPWVPEDLQGRPGDWYEELPDYYGICRRIDECYGRLQRVLEEEGIADDTIVVFTSDHGSHFKTRNPEYKRSCHEASVRVPLVLDGPGFEGGNVVEDPVSLLDLPPTLLDAADIDPPASMTGDPLGPVVAGDSEGRDAVFVQISEHEVGRAIRTDRWKYAVFDPEADHGDDPAGETYVERYLYDLDSDPHEQVNLVGRRDYADVAARLRTRLLDRIEAVEGERPTVEAADYYA